MAKKPDQPPITQRGMTLDEVAESIKGLAVSVYPIKKHKFRPTTLTAALGRVIEEAKTKPSLVVGQKREGR